MSTTTLSKDTLSKGTEEPSINHSNGENNELTFVALGVIFYSRLRLFVVAFSLVAILTVISYFMTPPRYEASVVVAIGSVSETWIEDVNEMAQRLEAENRFRLSEGRLDHVEKLTAERGIVEVFIHGSSPDIVMRRLATVSENLLKQHQKKYESLMVLHQSYIDGLSGRVSALEEEDKTLSVALTQERQKEQSASAPLLIVERAELAKVIPGLEEKLFSSKQQLLKSTGGPTRLLTNLTNAPRKLKPMPLLFVLVGVTMGILCGAITVLGSEFLKNVRTRIAESSTC